MSDPELERLLQRKFETMMGGSSRPTQPPPPINLDESNFSNVINGSLPVLVDFWAEWCGPCRFMGPIFEKLASKYNGRMVFARVDVDGNQGIAGRYGIMSIPTFLVFVKGRPVDGAIGAVTERSLEALVAKYAGS